MEYLFFGSAILIAVVIGFFIGKFSSRSNIKNLQNQLIDKNENFNREIEREDAAKTEFKQIIERLRDELKTTENERNDIKIELSGRNRDLQNSEEKLSSQKTEMLSLQKKFTTEFENLAQKILEQKSEKFTAENQKNIAQILSPLKEKISTFEEKIEKSNIGFLKSHTELGEKLKFLNEQNIKISEEANNLTKALKGESKTQGNWGELILEKVLEKSGLVKGREYEMQKSFKDDNGKIQFPDAVINLPNNKKMIIDAKVSLTAYERYVNTESEDEKIIFLKQHIKSMENHLKNLKNKKYENLGGDDTPDFILMFIPVEPALFLAQSENPSFFYSAFQDNILMVSPTTLLSTLRTVDMIWSNEKQQQNAKQIAQHAGDLYDKFVNLIEGMEDVGNRIDSTKSTYEKAMKKLTGQQNLVKDIEALKLMGVTSKKTIENKWLDNSKK
ncbi:DNA recombination protein RmuC [Psychroflexus aestuariivivens]|uniref:DNA recombination protein RmuC n=1 Tax=Psychroflexus aestuariivivens TaxID=1795040 RepID=UPI000FD6E64B|nr:DNA recombination protein RmuC [Psychroflexus aestuariivivens]